MPLTPRVFSVSELASFSMSVLSAAGIPAAHAESVTDHLLWADTHGRPNYGVWRLPILTTRAKAGLFETALEPSADRRSAALALVDGCNTIGHHGATVATDLAIEMAQEAGVATAAVRRSNFMGALGYYADRIANNEMVGFVVNNSHPRVAAHGGLSPVLGTNPLAFAAPLGDGTSVIVDMATSVTAGGFITRSAERDEPLPEGVAIERSGAPLTDASRIREGAMLPLGGPKGFGLGLMVEILAGVLTGAGVSHGVRSMYKDFDNPGDSGHMITAMNISEFISLETYYVRMDKLVEALKSTGDVRLPGEARYEARRQNEERGGVELDAKTAKALEELADHYQTDPPQAGTYEHEAAAP